MAQEKACIPAQLPLAWVLAQGDDIVSISGTKRRSYLEENVGAPKSIPNPRRSGPQLAHALHPVSTLERSMRSSI
jgi:hypothetical protein